MYLRGLSDVLMIIVKRKDIREKEKDERDG
jgi:hypothetical protein